MTRTPLAPIRVPEGTLRHVGCYKHKDRVLSIMRLPLELDPEEKCPPLWEDPMDQMFYCEVVKIEPLPVPSGSIFYMDYHYGEI